MATILPIFKTVFFISIYFQISNTPLLIAFINISDAFLASSLSMICLRWNSTVLTDIYNFVAISLLFKPSDMHFSTSCSRLLSTCGISGEASEGISGNGDRNIYVLTEQNKSPLADSPDRTV